jgi:hypothetical protein
MIPISNSEDDDGPSHVPIPAPGLPPVLATCGIHRHELGCESTSFCLLLLADSPEAEYNLKH